MDRLGDTFRWKGENVSTNEVGDVMSVAPSIEEANIFGVEIPGKFLAFSSYSQASFNAVSVSYDRLL